MLSHIINSVTRYSIFAVLFGIVAAKSQAQDRPTDFGTEWIRSHPLTIMGPIYGSATYDIGNWAYNFNLYQGMNLNIVFANNSPAVSQAAAAAGLPWQSSTGSSDTFYTAAQQALINQEIAGGHATG